MLKIAQERNVFHTVKMANAQCAKNMKIHEYAKKNKKKMISRIQL